jgi:hypothetical protein
VWAVAHVPTTITLSSNPIFHRLEDAFLDFIEGNIVSLYLKGLLDASHQPVGDFLFAHVSSPTP